MRTHLRFFFLLICTSLCSYERTTSYPYLSGDTWRFFADWRLSTEETFNPIDVQEGDTIFIEYDFLEEFGNSYLPNIKHHFILLTPNCESNGFYPQPGCFDTFLDSEKLAAWFVKNLDRPPTDRLIALPLGLANQIWPHGQISVLDPLVSQAPPQGSEKRDIFVYINFRPETNLAARELCFDYFKYLPCATFKDPVPFKEYLQDLSRSIFVVSPPGSGVDCHRTWEALLMGCYPIVLTSTLDPLYEGLPVVIIPSWEVIDEEFLQEKLEEFKNTSWQLEKLYAPYWIEKIVAIQQQLREKNLK